jgi:cyclomaltodextrinase
MKRNSLMIYVLLVFLVALGIFISCVSKEKKPLVRPALSEVKHLDWTRSAVIYEVNIRQFSKEGTFKGVEKELTRLKELGIDILWLMPVNPIGIKNHKGKLGSYYSVKDYSTVNPDYGKMDDFKQLVQEVHKLGMKIIIDWVPNHSSWDNPLTISHPEYYLKDSLGKFQSAFDWTDVIRFDYNNPGLRKYMTESMAWWYKETGIDGFRCDVAHMVPVDFWDQLRASLDSIKPIFMLAESDQPFLHKKAYDATYDWKFFHIMNEIAKGKMNAREVSKHFNWVDSIYPGDSYLMQFTSNHDENSWSGTEFERMGEGAKTFAVLCSTLPDMLLIYNGQESGFNRRLKFFEKDSISWGKYELKDFYKTLINLKKENKAIWNGNGGRPQWIATSRDTSVVAFARVSELNQIVVLANLSARNLDIIIKNTPVEGEFTDVFTNKKVTLNKGSKFILKPWEYIVCKK